MAEFQSEPEKQSEVIIIAVPKASKMKGLGTILLKVFVEPLLVEGKNLCVSTYGPQNSGKTTLLKPIEAAQEKGTLPVSDFASHDIGRHYWSWPPTFIELHEPPMRVPTPMDKEEGKRKLELLQHAPPHFIPDLAVTVSYPRRSYAYAPNMSYFGYLSDGFKLCANALTLGEEAAKKVMTIATVMEDAIEDALPSSRSKQRLVRIVLLSEDPLMQESFQNMKQAIEKASQPTRTQRIISSVRSRLKGPAR
jgi:hypothetical protein